MPVREQREKLNQLSKLCSRKGILPRPMHIWGLAVGSARAECSGGSASLFRRMHNGIQVAVKVMNLTRSSDRDKVFRVSSISKSTTLY